MAIWLLTLRLIQIKKRQARWVFSKKFQQIAIGEFIDSVNSPSNQGLNDKIFSVIAYISLIGGRCSEYNLLMLLKYASIDIDDDKHVQSVKNLLSFYCGTEIVDIIDNGLGIADSIKDPADKSFMKGAKSDTTKILNALGGLQQNLISALISGCEAYDAEKDRNSDLP